MTLRSRPQVPDRRHTSTLQVACAANRDWVPHCATMLHSLIVHQGPQVHVHFIGEDDVNPDLERDLSRMVTRLGAEISTYRVPRDRLRDLPDHVPKAQWYRIFLPDVLANLDRALFLDADLIVTDSLHPLWDLDLSGRWLAAVTTVFPSLEWGDRHCAAIGLRSRDYFNCGVLLLQLEELRRNDCTRQIRDYVLAHPHRLGPRQLYDEGSFQQFREYARMHPDRLLFPEQDAINVVLAARRLTLHPRWNCMHQCRFPWSREIFGADAIAEALQKPAIRHFEGGANNKPWHPQAPAAARQLYWKHRNQTPWPNRVEARLA